MESQNFEYAHMSPTTMTPNTNITPSTSNTLNALNLSSTSQSSINSALDSLQSPAQILLINTSNPQQPTVIDTTAGAATTLPPQTLPNESTINEVAQDLAAVLVNQEQLLVMNENALDTTNQTQISIAPSVSIPSLIPDPTKVIDQVLASQQEDQPPQLTINAAPTTQVVVQQEPTPTSVIIEQAILEQVNREIISTIPPTSTSSLIDLNRQQQVQQIDQATAVTTVNNLATVQAQAHLEMQAIMQAISGEPQPQDQQQQPHIIIEGDSATTAAVQVQQAHHNAVVAQAAVAAAAEAQAHAHAQAQQVQAQVNAQVQAAHAAQAAAAVAVAQAHAQAHAQSQSDSAQVHAQVQAQVQAAQTAQYVAAAAMAHAQVEAQIQTQVQAQVQAQAAAVVAAAQQVAHAAVVQVAAAEQAQVVQAVMSASQVQPGPNNSEQPPVVVMIDNTPVTNSQSVPTTVQTVQTVVNNDPLQLVESLANAQIVNNTRLEEQNRRLCVGIVNNHQLAADIQVNTTIGPQPEPILSVSKPPMADLLNSTSIVPTVTPAWNLETSNSNMVVPAPLQLINVSDEHNAVVLDPNILDNNTPQAQTLTFVNENPQLDMQSSQKSAETTNSIKMISEVPSQHHQQQTNTLVSEVQVTQINEQQISEKSPQLDLGDLIDNQSNLNSSSQKDSVERDNNTSPKSINVAAQENVGVIRDFDGNNLPRKNSTSNVPNSSITQQIINDEDLDLIKVEPSKSVESHVSSNWSTISIEDMSTEQLLIRLAQYEYPNWSRDQLISKIKYYEQRERDPKSRILDSKGHKRARSSNSRRSSMDSDVSIVTPEDEMEDVKGESNRSETTVAGYSAQSSPSMSSSNVKQEVEEDKKEIHKCMWRGCAKVLFSLDSLISHVGDTHIGSGKATYSCDWEGCTRGQKPFTKRHKMYNHLRTHTGERPFVCTVNGCGKRFSRPDSLTTHVKTHSNHRPYICPYKGCNKAYYHSRSLRKHEKTHDIRTPHTLPPVHPSGISIPNTGMHINFAPPNRMYSASQPQPSSHQPHQPHHVFPQKPTGIDSTSNSLSNGSRDIRSVPPPPQPIHPHHLPPVHQLHPSSPVGPASSNSAFSFSQHRLLPVQSTSNTLPPHGYHYPLQPPPLNHRPELIHHHRASQAPLSSTSPPAHFFTHTTNSFSQPPSSNVPSRSNNNNTSTNNS